MLTLGEFVLRKGVVDSIGAKNLTALNEGLISYTDMLNMAMGNQKNQQKQKSKYSTDLVSYLSGGGLAGSSSFSVPKFNNTPSNTFAPTGTSGGGSGFSTGDIHIHNPKPERASDSLPRTIRKISYLGDRKPAYQTTAVSPE